MRPRRYYQFIAKDHKVSSAIWKVLHCIIFVGIFFASLIAAEAFCDIFDIFNYRCILYAKASTQFLNIVYKNSSIVIVNETDSERVEYLELNPQFFEENVEQSYMLRRNTFRNSHRTFDITKAKKVPGVNDIYILDDELWIDNHTLTGRAHVGMTTTFFESVFLCDFVVFVPFASVIVCSFFGLITVLFSRTGGKSLNSTPSAFMYVYPLAIVASVMTILSLISCSLVYYGLNKFCTHFSHLTGKQECSPLMDYFTKEQKLGHRHLYHQIYVSKGSYFTMAVLWICQIVIVLLRLLTTADFVLTSVLIKSKRRWDDDDAEEILHMYWESTPVPALADVVDQLRTDSKAT